MHKYIIVLFYVWLLLSSFSCKSQSTTKEKDSTSFKKFPVEKNLEIQQYMTLTDIQQDELPLFDELTLYKDSLLFLANLTGGKTLHFIVFDLNKKVHVRRFLKYGGKKGSSLGFMSFGISGNKFWVNDIMKKKLIVNNLDNILSGNDTLVNEYPMPVFYYSSRLVNDSILLASGNYKSEYKIAKNNIRNGKVEKEMFAYSIDSMDKWDMARKTAYESFLYTHPKGSKCVLAARYADRIEVFDLVKQTSKIIKGPESFEPRLKAVTDNSGNKISSPSQNTKLAFSRGHVTEKYIYLLYSGNKEFTTDKDNGKSIYVYDWNGNPVKKINLKTNIIDFVVTQDDKILYSYKPGLPYIYSSKL